jgi:hypothetical protein
MRVRLSSCHAHKEAIILPSIVAIIFAVVLLYFRREKATFSLPEATIKSLHGALFSGQTTCIEIVNEYLVRINTYDNQLHSVLAINPHAKELALKLDRLPHSKKVNQLLSLT